MFKKRQKRLSETFLQDRQDQGDKMICHLCQESIPKDDWEDSSNHRVICSSANQEKLDSFEVDLLELCPDCNKKLLLWPKDLGPTLFTCDKEDCR
jgi:hypothetical protein